MDQLLTNPIYMKHKMLYTCLLIVAGLKILEYENFFACLLAIGCGIGAYLVETDMLQGLSRHEDGRLKLSAIIGLLFVGIAVIAALWISIKVYLL
jgi:hypothetical protein